MYKSFFANDRTICTTYLNWGVLAIATKWLGTVQTKRFMKKIRKQTFHGFRVNIFMSAGNSKHFKHSQHVHNITDFDVMGNSLPYTPVPFSPNYRPGLELELVII